MLSTRIGIAGACILLCAALGVASAAAQTEPAGTAGKPLALLQFIHKNGKAKLRPHSETLTRSNGGRVRRTRHALASNLDGDRRKLENATAQAHQAPAPQSPAAAAPNNAWPAAAPGRMSIRTPQPAPIPQPAPAPAASGAVVAAASNAAGAPLAATTAQPAAKPTQALPTSPQPAAAKPVPPPPMKAAQAAAPENQTLAETAAPAVRATVVTPADDDAGDEATGQVGSVSWIAQVLAALGGAFAAGAIAWFLISPASRPVGS